MHGANDQRPRNTFWARVLDDLASARLSIARRVTVGPQLPAGDRASRGPMEAIYEGGVLRPKERLPLDEGTPVRLIWEAVTPQAVDLLTGVVVGPLVTAPSDAAQPVGSARSTETARMRRLQWVLFGMGLLVYLFTRLYALDRFPIYFFSDEAIKSTFAQELIDRGFKDTQGHSFPLFFEVAGNRWMPLLPVYIHAVTDSIFGKSIVVNRGTSALVSLLAAASVSLILGLIFKARFWWAGGLLMAVAPAWFLHSRTEFETVTMTSFFACFLLCYLLYRRRNPKYLFAAVLFGAATFYSYSNGQLIIGVAAVLLLLSDLRYHARHWRTVLLAALLVVVLSAPLLRFNAWQPKGMTTHLRAINSYLFEPVPLAAKLERFGSTYYHGLSPQYWFVPNEDDLVRHRMKGYGNLPLPLLPFFAIGVGLCLWRFRSAPHRDVLLALVATPAGAALIDVSITRVLAFTVPATILIGLGIEAAVGFAGKRVRVRVPYAALAAILFVVFTGASLWMLRDALANGLLWYRDYGLYGMQYGAKQLFQETVPEILAENPKNQVMMTSGWANGADIFPRFFLTREQRSRIVMRTVDYYMDERQDLDQNTVLAMMPGEYQKAMASQKFSKIDIKRLVAYPDGSPAFYFATLEYSPRFDEILAPEKEARVRPVEELFTLDGQQVKISHSPFDMGALSSLFDGDTFTLARGMAANPLVLDFAFPEPRSIRNLAADFGSMDFILTAQLFETPGSKPVVYTQEYRGQPPDPHIEFQFARGPEKVSRIRLEFEQLQPPHEVHIHVREVRFR